MKIAVANAMSDVAKIDLLEPKPQLFQEMPPSISKFISNSRAADCFLVPHDASDWTPKYTSYIGSLSNEKPILFFNRSDYARSIAIKNAISIQNSANGKITIPTIIVPYNIKPIVRSGIRNYAERPVLSFVGYVPRYGIKRSIKATITNPVHPLMNNAAYVRRRGIQVIRHNFPEAVLITRSHYGGARSLIANLDNFRETYIQSILNSDIVFSPRGDANFSQRFYETLSGGRIPIVPDTKVRFPRFDDREKLHYVTCNFKSSNLVENVLEFWQKLDHDSYNYIQQANRRIFETKLNYEIYINSIFENDWNVILQEKVLFS